MRHIAVVGASLAGYRAAQTLRQEGFDGTITIVGDEPHRPYDRPPLSKRFLTHDLAVEDLTLERHDDNLDLDWRLGTTAKSFDAARLAIELSDGELRCDGVIIACGASPRTLPSPVPGSTPGGVHVLRTADDARALRRDLQAGPQRLVVIGAGFIGSEVAASARSMGIDVTIVEALSLPLARALPAPIGEVCAELHRDQGVDLRLATGVVSLVVGGDGRVAGVELDDGTVIDADVVLVGIGVVPNTDWLEGSGLVIDNGVVCDETTLAAPGVVAAGDVARWRNPHFDEVMRIEHWDNAVSMGQHAAKRLLAGDGPGEPFAPVPYFWSDQYDRKIQLMGRASPTDRIEVVEGSLSERRFVAIVGRGDRLVGAIGMNRPPAVMAWAARIGDKMSFEEALNLTS